MDECARRLERSCRKSGCRITQQRVEVYRHLCASKDHPSAETLHRRVQADSPFVSLETVYRSLGFLESVGLAYRINTQGKRARYDADVTPHAHLICRQCETIRDLPPVSLDLARLVPSANGWGRVESVDVVLTGVCRRCFETDGKSARSDASPPDGVASVS